MRIAALALLGLVVAIVVLVTTYPIVLVAAWGLLVFAVLAARHHHRYGRHDEEHLGGLLAAGLVGYLVGRRHRN